MEYKYFASESSAVLQNTQGDEEEEKEENEFIPREDTAQIKYSNLCKSVMNNQSLLELMLSTEFSQHQQMHQELDNFEEFRKYIIDLAHQVIELKEIEINQISNEENNQEEGYRNEEEEGNQRNEGNEEEGDGGSESELDWMYKAFETPGLVFLKLLTEEYLSELLHPILKQVEKPQMKEEESEGEGNEEAEEEYPSE